MLFVRDIRNTDGDEQDMNDGYDADDLVRAAIAVRKRAYAPYSNFKVGAAVITRSGRVYVGCNVENGAYSPTMCAERVALGSAIAAGEPIGSFVAMAVVGDESEPTTPCGVCRQVLTELASGCTVIMEAPPERKRGGDGLGVGRLEMTVEQLLPKGFMFQGRVRIQ